MSAPAYQSITEFYRDPASPYAGFAQEHRSGGAMPVKMMRAEQEPFEATDPATSNVIVSLVLRGQDYARWDLGDGWSPVTEFRPGHISVVPSQIEIPQEHLGRHEMIAMSLPVGPLSSLLKEHDISGLSPFELLPPVSPFRDEHIRRTIWTTWREATRSGGTSDLLIDGLVQVLIARLLDKAGAVARPVQVPTLSQDELDRLDRLIAAQLAERITVETLAQALDMPRWTFADAFKATLGETPHAYVTARRVERACDLLRLGDLPLAEIAYATGFSSQSHMTDTFRRVLDTTPGAWRREVRK